MPRHELKVSPQFSSALERIRWADEQIIELKARSLRFFQSNKYERITEIDPKTQYKIDKIKLSGPLPSPILRNAVQIIEGLRAALDHGTCAIVKGASHKKRTYFPFAKTKREFDAILGTKCKYVPEEIKKIFKRLKPYKRGNPALWALNEMCNTGKHRTIVEPGIHFKDIIFDDVWEVGEPDKVLTPHPIWNAGRHEIIISRAKGRGTIHHDVELSMTVAFGKVPVFRGKPVLPVFRYFASTIERILWTIENEARKIKVIK